MTKRKDNYYEVLGVRPTATQRDIERAWRKLLAEFEDDRTAPDARRQMMAQEAYDALSDPKRRAAYDEMLAGPKMLGIRGGSDPRKRWTVAIGTTFVALGLAYWFLVARQPEAGTSLYPATEGAMEVHTKASVAIGRVNRIDMSGKATPLGVAVAVQEGVMMAPCAGLVPGTQITVAIPPRAAPGQILSADESLGLCLLRMHAGGSWPLTLTAQEPRPGDRIFAVQLNPQGEVALKESKVERLTSTPTGRVVEVAKHLTQVPDGTPLLDVHGRVFAVAMQSQHRMLPAGWISRAQPDAAPPRPAAPTKGPDDEREARPAPELRRPMRPEDITPERRERLEKAFRPPPTMPDDL